MSNVVSSAKGASKAKRVSVVQHSIIRQEAPRKRSRTTHRVAAKRAYETIAESWFCNVCTPAQ